MSCDSLRKILGIVARLNPIHLNLIKAIGQRHSKCGHLSGIGWDGTAAISRLASRSGGGASSGLGRSGMDGSSISLKSVRPNTAISTEAAYILL
mmetsp:Transcript_18432/g.33385  ORF Transcript_18432/g.33385 Transcript_18432/m.33385 type:complete len:94 (+) Transcript_18432:655-936(+)